MKNSAFYITLSQAFIITLVILSDSVLSQRKSLKAAENRSGSMCLYIPFFLSNIENFVQKLKHIEGPVY